MKIKKWNRKYKNDDKVEKKTTMKKRGRQNKDN